MSPFFLRLFPPFLLVVVMVTAAQPGARSIAMAARYCRSIQSQGRGRRVHKPIDPVFQAKVVAMTGQMKQLSIKLRPLVPSIVRRVDEKPIFAEDRIIMVESDLEKYGGFIPIVYLRSTLSQYGACDTKAISSLQWRFEMEFLMISLIRDMKSHQGATPELSQRLERVCHRLEGLLQVCCASVGRGPVATSESETPEELSFASSLFRLPSPSQSPQADSWELSSRRESPGLGSSGRLSLTGNLSPAEHAYPAPPGGWPAWVPPPWDPLPWDSSQ